MTAQIVTAYTAPDGTKVAEVRYQGSTLTVRQTPKLTTTVWFGTYRVTKRDNPNAFHAAVEAATAEWANPGSQPGLSSDAPVGRGPSPEVVKAAVSYPPLTTEDAEEVLAQGIAFVATGAGAYSFDVEELRTHRRLGRVTCRTESIGEGFWLHFAAYLPDGSRAGYAKTRPEAARLLLADRARQLAAAGAKLTPAGQAALSGETNAELWH